MNPDQRKRALKQFYGYLAHDWVQLEVAVQCANETVGYDDLQFITPDTREFVTSLIQEEGLATGVLDQNGRFIAWSGSKEERTQRILDLMRLGEKTPGPDVVWFDRPKEEPNQSSQPTPSGRG
jgi:hypothetical protein